jgi:hypothetical protein
VWTQKGCSRKRRRRALDFFKRGSLGTSDRLRCGHSADGNRIEKVSDNSKQDIAFASRMHQVIESRPCTGSSDSDNLSASSPPSPNILDWLLVIEWCMIVILAVAFVGLALVPGWRSLNSEFPDYYLAAELYHQGAPLDRVYEWTWFQRQNDHLGVRDGLVSFAPNPPTFILPMLPFVRLQPLAAKRVWLSFNLVFLALSLLCLRYTTSLGWRRLVLIALLCVLPLDVDFLFGRFYVFILFLICLAYYASCRNRNWAAGAIWSCAAALKLFPAFSVILFIRRRDWRSFAGFLVGAITLVAVSIFLFGAEVHRVFLREVLSQASRGDWLGPYALSQNSFITLWSHLFLIEPDLNPSPLINSPTLYAIAISITVTVPVIGFLFATNRESTSPSTMALHWASLVPLLLLLSTTTAPDHSCVLIFAAVVGFDALLAKGHNRRALTLLILYAGACAPVPFMIAQRFPIYRLVAITGLYALLLHSAVDVLPKRHTRLWWPIGVASVTVLALYTIYNTRSRAEDFSSRLSIGRNGYRFANPVPIANGIGFTEMQPSKYAAVVLAGGKPYDFPAPVDSLTIAGSPRSDLLYSELAGPKSLLVRIPVERSHDAPETLTEGQDPALSPNGQWLTFIREERGERTAWRLATNSPGAPQKVLPSTYQPIDVTVTNEGDVIASAGNVSDPHLLFVKHAGQEVIRLSTFLHPVRYPAISLDGKRLAFSRRDRGSWHLFVGTLANGYEQQLTHAPCNAISPSWEDDQTLLYATDCGRGVGLSALARVVLPN